MKRASSSNKGGVRQKQRRRHHAEALGETSSVLVTLLLSLFSWGEMSPQLVQKIAQAAYKDAVRFKEDTSSLMDLEKISNIGCSGTYANKCYGDLLKVIPYNIHVPRPMFTRLPFKSPLDSLTQGMLWPHELFAVIYEHYKATWSQCILPSTERLNLFWETNKNHPAMAGSKVQTIENYESWVVPLCLHGDDVPITGVGKSWCQQMTVFSWSSLIGLGSTKDMQYFIYGCFEKLRATSEDQSKDTLGIFFKQMVWSLKWLQLGQWPDRDWTGKKCLVLQFSEMLYLLDSPFSFTNGNLSICQRSSHVLGRLPSPR